MTYRIIVIVLSLLCIESTIVAQGAGDYAILKVINPRYPDNRLFKTFSRSAYPVAFSLPIGIMAVSIITENKKGQQVGYEMMGGLILSAAATGAIKELMQRPRPYQRYNDIYPDEWEDGNSFPSGHTSLSFSNATSILLSTEKWYLAAPAYLWACGVGYSRIYLGQHYPSDVIAGAITGAGGAYLSHLLRKKLFEGPRRRKPVRMP
ncbi:MAG: phosphatase PAP2 family protein [Cytophagales bacterium]|nr:phosphatase PAP2 family protein [Cytophagales bacterium]